MRISLLTGFALCCLTVAQAAPLDSLTLQPKEEAGLLRRFSKQLDSIDRKIVFYTGHISLSGGNIQMTVPDGFLFIDGPQSRFILEELWGNMPDMEVSGMLVRDGFRATKLGNDHSFVLSYSDIGYVPDKKDNTLDHHDLLETLQENMESSNASRIEMGFNTLSVTGWVMVPYYDQYKNAVYWATRVRANGSDEEILNYNLRLLGRNGVIKISAVATMDQLPAIKQELPAIIAQTRFAPGAAYADFKPDADQQSDWNLRDMVAGRKQEKGFFTRHQASLKWAGLLLLAGGIGATVFGWSQKKKQQALA